MNLTNPQKEALFKLYPQIAILRDGEAFDAENNEVSYDIDAVNAKVTADAEAEVAAKESALSKLSALGLTEAEIKALTGN